jgi:hypothetical protein
MLTTAAPARSGHRARLVVVALVAALALMATACHEDNTPQFYNSVTKDNFIQGCTGSGTGANGATGTTLASNDLCTCLYNVTTASIPASSADKKKRSQQFGSYTGKTFIQINDSLKNDPNSLPSSLTDAYAEHCGAEGYKGAPTTTTKSGSGGGPTTTKGN